MPRLNSKASRSWLPFYIILTLGISNSVLRLKGDPQTTEAGHGCSSITPANSTVFKENLNTIFSLLAEDVSSTGFGTATAGSGINEIYGLAQCRNDLSKEDCSTCYAAARNQIVAYCPDDTGARMIYDGCFLRFENSTFFDQVLDVGYSNVCVSGVSSNPKLFNETVLKLLVDIKSKALQNEGFAKSKISVDGLSTAIYALGMCRRTLNTSSCDLCLQTAIQIIQECFSLQDGRALEAGCYLRYSTIAFFSTSSSSSLSKIAIILIGTLGGAALILVLGLLIIFRPFFRKLYDKVSSARSKYKEAEVYFTAEEDPRWDNLFTYESLRSATKKFDSSMRIGGGGFGEVYKAIFNDGREVAVKKLFAQKSSRGSDDFVTEVKLVGAVRHRNLVRLLGCCTRGLEKMLVYEFMPNMSLDRHLFAKTGNSLSWKTRFQMILGTAHGLAYLNEESPLRILHRDIKAANILLDKDFEVKIADFGLARLFPEDLTHITTRIGGTIGYMAPEYAVHGRLTEKADVYSYGVLVLEIVAGRKYVDSTLPGHMELLLEWAWGLYEKNEAFRIVDRRLIGEEAEMNKEKIVKVIHIAFLCTQGAPELRPLMSTVVSMLTSTTHISVHPTQPAFIESNETSANGLGSVNVNSMEPPSISSSHATVTVSQLEPR